MFTRSVRPVALVAALAGLAFACSLANGQALQQASQPASTTPAGPQPRVEFEKLTHQFGVIGDEREVAYEFKFRNTGDSNLEIFELKGSCGCTVPALEKKVYAPGESGQIKVIYNPNNRRGKQHTTVTVTTNDPIRAQLTLGVESEVKPTIMTDPQVASLGQVERGKEASTTITITSRRKDILPVQVTPGDAKVNALLKEYEEIQVDGETVYRMPIEISLSPNAPVGPIQTQCVVRTTDPSRTLNFMVLGEVVGMIKAEPARVTLGGLAPGAEINTTLQLSARNNKQFKILAVEEAPAAMPSPTRPEGMPAPKMFTVAFDQVASPEGSANPPMWNIRLTGVAPNESGTFRGDLVIKTDMPGEEEMKVQYYGFIRQRARPMPAQAPVGQPSMLIPD
jgi:hypothetical protein